MSLIPFLPSKWQKGTHLEMKEYEETTARDLTDTDASKVSDAEFRVTIVRILAGVQKSLESLCAEKTWSKNWPEWN